jgi:hypothetical protein
MRTVRAMRWLAVASLAGIALGAAPAKASVIYDYTGNLFSGIQNVALGTSLDAQVIFTDAITPNYTGEALSQQIISVSFSATNSTFAFTTTQPGESAFGFVNGQITTWYLEGNTPGYGLEAYTNYGSGLPIADNDFTQSPPSENYVYNNQGSWTRVSATPLPGSLLLFGSGLVGVAAVKMARGRRRAAG